MSRHRTAKLYDLGAFTPNARAYSFVTSQPAAAAFPFTQSAFAGERPYA
jgi:hypothetical protein